MRRKRERDALNWRGVGDSKNGGIRYGGEK